jgi:regulator of RNase E activity RraB
MAIEESNEGQPPVQPITDDQSAAFFNMVVHPAIMYLVYHRIQTDDFKCTDDILMDAFKDIMEFVEGTEFMNLLASLQDLATNGESETLLSIELGCKVMEYAEKLLD